MSRTMTVDGQESKYHHEVKAWVNETVLAEALEKHPELIGSIDNGTSSTRFLVFTPLGKIAASAQVEYNQIFPSGEGKTGWHEHDPLEIWQSVVTCVEAVTKALTDKDITFGDRPLAAIGITTQRETTIAWNAETGAPYYNAIVWDDLRTTNLVDEIAKGDQDRLRSKTGLPLSTYFSGTKVKWLIEHVPQLREDLGNQDTAENVRFGTVDAWLLYQLTGQKSSFPGAANYKGTFATDVTNASRWLFMNINTVQWDKELLDEICQPFDVPISALPRIWPSSHPFGFVSKDCGISALARVPITGILGDQQAALFGQCAFDAGKAKCTYGTGLFLLKNTGTKPVSSSHGLLTTVAYQIGVEGKVHYALEGSVSHSGSTIQWLRDKINLIEKASESESLAMGTDSNEGLYLVPAFAGLFAPHWRSDARACIVGMTASHHKGHICRAALEAACYQAREVFEAMVEDSPFDLQSLSVDGGATANRLMMQFQCDILNIVVTRPEVGETTALGAAFAAGLTVGMWRDLKELEGLRVIKEQYQPHMDDFQRRKNWHGWQKAVSRSMGWIESDEAILQKIKEKTALETALPLIFLSGLAAGIGYILGQNRKL